MLRIFITGVFLILIHFSIVAQSGSNERCEVSRPEDPHQFEQWLNSRRVAATGLSSNTVYKIPVVVHILTHSGEPIGEGFNFSEERVREQIKTLNEDFRRRKGTPGFNTHADGGDTGIEFVLAETDPEGNLTNGITRVDISSVHPPPLPPDQAGDIITDFTRFSYWNPDFYLNIWCADIGLPPGLLLGSARFPISDLQGLPTQNPAGDGVFINAYNFGRGETNTDPDYNMGRTLTHEIGHFLGLLHIWGECGRYSDYCEDTPAVNSPTNGCPSIRPMACDGSPAMIENYMDYSYDRCMNMFTNDQITRMRTVLENSPRRKSLITSPVITGLRDDIAPPVNVYPNPATDVVYISPGKDMHGQTIHVKAYTLLGKLLFERSATVTSTDMKISISDVHEKMMILSVEGEEIYYKQLIVIN